MYQGSYFIEVMGMCMLMAGEKFNDHCVMKSVRIMVWGCIHSTGVGFLTNVEERLNGDAYIENYMIPSGKARPPNKNIGRGALASMVPTSVISLLLFMLLV